MTGTPQGAQKAIAKMLARDPDHFRKIGKLGGSQKNPTKGFGHPSANPSAAGMRGGVKSRRRRVTTRKQSHAA